MWNGRGRAAVAALVCVLAGACGGKGERPATRPEALAACIKGCVGKVEAVAKAAPSPEQRRTCDQTCACIVDEMFLPSGAQRADAKPMAEIAVACAGRFAGAAAPAASAAPASPLPFPGLMPLPAVRDEKDLPPLSKEVIGRTLIAGTRCGKARLPKLAYDQAHDRVSLVGEPFSWDLPAEWKVRLERRDLLRTWGPPSADGVFRVIELFVTAHCAGGYDTRPVYERIAAIDPFDAEAHSTLGRLAMQRNEPDVATREFRTVIALGPVDRAAAFTDLAESYFKAGRKSDAKKEALAALEIAPSFERAQALLLGLVN